MNKTKEQKNRRHGVRQEPKLPDKKKTPKVKLPWTHHLNVFIKSWDLFGKELEFNYQREGTYKTTMGGIMSLLI